MSTIKDKSFITKISKLGRKMAQQSRAFVTFIDNTVFSLNHHGSSKLSVAHASGYLKPYSVLLKVHTETDTAL